MDSESETTSIELTSRNRNENPTPLSGNGFHSGHNDNQPSQATFNPPHAQYSGQWMNPSYRSRQVVFPPGVKPPPPRYWIRSMNEVAIAVEKARNAAMQAGLPPPPLQPPTWGQPPPSGDLYGLWNPREKGRQSSQHVMAPHYYQRFMGQGDSSGRNPASSRQTGTGLSGRGRQHGPTTILGDGYGNDLTQNNPNSKIDPRLRQGPSANMTRSRSSGANIQQGGNNVSSFYPSGQNMQGGRPRKQNRSRRQNQLNNRAWLGDEDEDSDKDDDDSGSYEDAAGFKRSF